jgi:hypothetical protein
MAPLSFPCSRLDRSANGWSPCVLPHICATIEQTKLLWEGPHRADRHLEQALTKRRPLDSRGSGKSPWPWHANKRQCPTSWSCPANYFRRLGLPNLVNG